MVVYPGMYIGWYPSMVVYPGMYIGWYIRFPTVPRVHMGYIRLPTVPGCTWWVYTPPYHTRVVPWWVYTPPYCTPCTTPGIPHPLHYRVHCSTAAGVRDDNTLGSRREKTLGESLL